MLDFALLYAFSGLVFLFASAWIGGYLQPGMMPVPWMMFAAAALWPLALAWLIVASAIDIWNAMR